MSNGNNNLCWLLLEIWHIFYHLFCLSSFSDPCCALTCSVYLKTLCLFNFLRCTEFVGLFDDSNVLRSEFFECTQVFLVFQCTVLFVISFSKLHGRLHCLLFAYLQCLCSTLNFVDRQSHLFFIWCMLSLLVYYLIFFFFFKLLFRQGIWSWFQKQCAEYWIFGALVEKRYMRGLLLSLVIIWFLWYIAWFFIHNALCTLHIQSGEAWGYYLSCLVLFISCGLIGLHEGGWHKSDWVVLYVQWGKCFLLVNN